MSLGDWGTYTAYPGIAGCSEERDATGRRPALLALYDKEKHAEMYV